MPQSSLDFDPTPCVLCRACGLSKLLLTEPCNVFSLGSHGQVDFEQAVLERWPHCRVFVYDHTLTDKQRAAVLAVNGERSRNKHAGALCPVVLLALPLPWLAGKHVTLYGSTTLTLHPASPSPELALTLNCSRDC